MNKDYMYLYNISTGFIKSYALKIALDLDIPKQLKDSPKTIKQLAEQCNVNERMLYVLLRTLSTMEIFEEDKDQDMLFHNSHYSSILADDNSPVSNGIKFNLSFIPIYGSFKDTIKTGKPKGLEVWGVNSFWEYVNSNPTFQNLFHLSMTTFTSFQIKGILNSIDFNQYKTIVDLGGSKGELLKSILKQFPQNHRDNNIDKVINYDLKSAFDTIKESNIDNDPRYSNLEGDLFNDVALPISDCFLIKHVLHMFNDEQSLSILNKISKSSTKTTKLYIFEHIIYKNKHSISISVEFNPLHVLNGHERTLKEWETLISKSNFKIDQIDKIQNSLCSYIICILKDKK